MERKGKKINIISVLFIILGVAILGAGIWLFTKTFGTKLLFESVLIGKFCKYFWVLWLVGILFFLIGILTIGKKKVESTLSDGQEADSVEPESTELKNSEQEAPQPEEDKTVVAQEPGE